MKRIIALICSLGLLAIYGCGSDSATPEDYSKNHVKKLFNKIPCDLDDVEYTVTTDGDDKATVVIEGEIQYKETLSLVKKDGKWILACEAAKLDRKAEEEARAQKAEPKEKKPAH